MFSKPIESLTVTGLTPAFANSSGLIWEWVVDAGWVIKDLLSPIFTTTLNSLTLSMILFASSKDSTSKEIRPDAFPPLKYFCAFA